MINLKLQAAKQGFFDRAGVQGAMDRATAKVLSKFGAFVRQRARTSIRRSKKISSPGSPPRSHTDLLKKLILFSYDPKRKSVVIGPTLLNRGNGSAPRILEEGGQVRRTINGTLTAMRYRKRPYMLPAFQAELSKLAESFKDTVKP